MIYLASVYSYNATPELLEERFKLVETYVAKHKDKPIFSPIVYGHQMAKDYDFPVNFEYWQERNHAFIDACDEVWILKMDDWDKSKGVADEIEYAMKTHKPVRMVSLEDEATPNV